MDLEELITRIDEIKDTGNLSLCIGIEESDYFDAKGSRGYDLGSVTNRFELAKDISSFANAHGGYIVIGLSTEPIPTRKTEVVSSLDLINAEGIEDMRSQYLGVIRELVYPTIKGLQIDCVADNSDQGSGLLIISIPKQDEDKKHFLIKGILDGGTKIQGVVFGIARREGSSSIPLTIQQLHQAVLRGKHSNAARLTRVEEKVDLLLDWLEAPRSSEAASSDLVDQRIDDAENQLSEDI